MLEKLETLEQVYAIVKDDPVRTHIPADQRLQQGKDVFVLRDDEENITAVICIAYTNDIPHSVKELDMMSELAHLKDEKNIAIAYTVWSRKRGAGKEIIHKVLEFAKKEGIKQVVTLSPLTPMATHFHIRNGAKQISINKETQNFEYNLKEKK